MNDTTRHAMFVRHRHALGAGLGLLVVAGVLTYLAARDPQQPAMQGIDDRWHDWMIDGRSPALTRVARECVEVKLISWEPGLTRDFWWQPYDHTLGQAVRASARLLYGRNGQRLKALREGGLPLLRVGARTLRKDR